MVSFYSIEDFNRFNFNKYTRYSNTFNIDKILNKITKMSNKKNSIILYKHNSLNSVIKLNRRVNNINMIYVNYLSSIMYILPLYIRVYIGKIMLFILFVTGCFFSYGFYQVHNATKNLAKESENIYCSMLTCYLLDRMEKVVSNPGSVWSLVESFESEHPAIKIELKKTN